MALKFFKPVTPGQRQKIHLDQSELKSGGPRKELTEGLHKRAGRNNMGRITSRHRGGGSKRRYRIIDFKRQKLGKATVESIEYDPNRTAFIALIKYHEDNEFSYILAPQKLKQGDVVEAGPKADIKPGNALPLSHIPVGTIIHNVELKPGKGAQLARSAGTYIQLMGKDSGYALIRLRSGEVRKVSGSSMAVVGAVSNSDHQNVKLGKAGRNRHKGRRPHVRGVAMNPVDHPMGGGEGKTSGGRHPVSPWGQKSKGLKTRKCKFTSKFIVKRKSKK